MKKKNFFFFVNQAEYITWGNNQTIIKDLNFIDYPSQAMVHIKYESQLVELLPS